jgi:hypothetical protein
MPGERHIEHMLGFFILVVLVLAGPAAMFFGTDSRDTNFRIR